MCLAIQTIERPDILLRNHYLHLLSQHKKTEM